jgi:hypothetical protein
LTVIARIRHNADACLHQCRHNVGRNSPNWCTSPSAVALLAMQVRFLLIPSLPAVEFLATVFSCNPYGSSFSGAALSYCKGKLLGYFCEVIHCFSRRSTRRVVKLQLIPPEISGPFVGGCAGKSALLGSVGQSVYYLQTLQSRINTGYFACR